MSRWARPVCGATRGRVAAGSRWEAGCLCEVQEASPAFLTWTFFAITPPRSRQQPPCPADGPQLLFGVQASATIFSSLPHPSFQSPPWTRLGSTLSQGTACLPTVLWSARCLRASLWGWRGWALALAQCHRCHASGERGCV